METVLQWLRHTAACPTSHSASASAQSRSKRQHRKRRQQPGMQTSHNHEAEHPALNVSQAQHAHQAQHAQQAQQPQQLGQAQQPDQDMAVASRALSPDTLAVQTNCLHSQLKTSSRSAVNAVPSHLALPVQTTLAVGDTAPKPVESLASPSVIAASSSAATALSAAHAQEARPGVTVTAAVQDRVSPQQFLFMDTLSQLRAAMFEDISVELLEDLPAAGKVPAAAAVRFCVRECTMPFAMLQKPQTC